MAHFKHSRSKALFTEHWWYWLGYVVLVALTMTANLLEGIHNLSLYGVLYLLGSLCFALSNALQALFCVYHLFSRDDTSIFNARLLAVAFMIISGYSMGWFAVDCMRGWQMVSWPIMNSLFSSILLTFRVVHFIFARFMVEYEVSQLKDYAEFSQVV